jgi:hypothetical protein
VRTLVALVAGLAVIPLAAAARPGPSTLSLTPQSHKVLYGHSVTLSGRLTGAHHAGRMVAIDARTYGSSSPHRIATVTTNANGAWSFTARPRLQTSYQAHAGTAMSRRVAIGVAPAVTVNALANGRLRVHIAPVHHFTRRLVQLQARNAAGGWTTVDRMRLNRASTAVFGPRMGNATIRFALSVNQAGAGFLGAASHALLWRPKSLQLSTSGLTVLYGHHVTLTGRVVNGRAGERVTITARRYGHPDYRFAIVRTGPGGVFSFNARPSILTTYRARLASGRMSPRVVVDVRPTITVRELRNGRVQTHVAAGRSMRGRMVQLQRFSGSRWTTLAKRPLHAGSTATFAFPLSSSTIRVAMSVNQAGAGYTGSTSHPLVYTAV